MPTKKLIQIYLIIAFILFLPLLLRLSYLIGDAEAKKVNCISEAQIRLDLEKKLTLTELNNPIIQEMVDSEVISAKEQLKAKNIQICK